MNKLKTYLCLFVLILLVGCQAEKNHVIRFATYNAALNRPNAGDLLSELKTGDSEQAKMIAEVIQVNRPEVLVLQEFDYDAKGEGLQIFHDQYLSQGQHGEKAIVYPYRMIVPSNTGLLAEVDLNGDGKIALPVDGYGFGAFEGQYAFVILSQYPFQTEGKRSFQNFLWKDMPNALRPINPETNQPYFTNEAWNVMRLSSKNHLDLPVVLPTKEVIHLLIAHPTPPVFDGPEDRNGKRNHDEIRMISDYITPNTGSYLQDDNGVKGGLSANESFVIFGDMNADPVDGDSYDSAILQILNNPRVHSEVATGTMVPQSQGSVDFNNGEHARKGEGGLSTDTSHFGLRIDYVLPSSNLNVVDTKVFWRGNKEEGFMLTQGKKASDHRMVWVDIVVN